MHRAAIEYFPRVLGYPSTSHFYWRLFHGWIKRNGLLHHIEKEDPSDIIVDKTVIGGGIYDLRVAFEDFVKQDMPSILQLRASLRPTTIGTT